MYKCTSGWDAYRYIDLFLNSIFGGFPWWTFCLCKGCNAICPTHWGSTVPLTGAVFVTFVTPFPVPPEAFSAAQRLALWLMFGRFPAVPLVVSAAWQFPCYIAPEIRQAVFTGQPLLGVAGVPPTLTVSIKPASSSSLSMGEFLEHGITPASRRVDMAMRPLLVPSYSWAISM